ncbi:MAG TPA: response regulator [Verrucomicrobiota bacterium]|nr:response regulator [Verrucomicrobiota bacterium]HRT58297.1 response regulator [Candidatus Paceibacterota bacterium]
MEPAAKRKILVVEGDEDWRVQVSASLTEAGYELLPAADPSEALRRAEDPALGLMLVNEDLNGESGRMLGCFLRRNHPEVPVLLCTNRDYPKAEILELMDQGIAQCVPKGNLEELIVTVGCWAQ